MTIQETTPIELVTYIHDGSNQVDVDYEILPHDGSCEISMYSDQSGTLLLDASESLYFDIDDQQITCNVNGIEESTDKTVFIGFEGDVFEFTCKFIN